MTQDTIHLEISEEAFDAKYPLVPNHLDPNAAWDGCLFETYGEELAFVRQQDPRYVWTLVDGCDGDQCVVSGIQLVNAIGYVISKIAVPAGAFIEVRIPYVSED